MSENKRGGEFSSILKLTDLDYIIPSQTCIKPVEIEKSAIPSKSTIEIESDGTYFERTETGEKKSLEKVGITLNDCLACSGCITSAESVLISAQSVQEFLGTSSRGKTIVISLSPQSRASLASHFKISSLSLVKKLQTFFKNMGIDYLFDTNFSRDFSLLESANEFVERFKQYKDNISSNTTSTSLPMLSSACPGWICYAEKTHGDYILPYISTTKSPQQIMGTLVKYYFSKHIIHKEPQDIYHVTIMPCYDKKLEASRNDFYNDIFKTKDVDCVLSTGEILELLSEKNVDLMSLEESELLHGHNNEFFNITTDGKDLIGTSGSSSGGYLEFVLKYAAKQLFNVDVDKIEYKVGRNPDFKETFLKVNGETVLTFAQAFGFRNIQNVVRKIKNGKMDYHFIEIMACPSGCINGGGQIKDTSLSVQANKLALQETESIYQQQQIPRSPLDNDYVKKIYQLWFNGYFTPDSKTNLHTQYHRIEKTISALNIKW
ncbi:nuclear prelamin A recognition factor-like protein [Tieghemostelium lacteum]|uniref:Nuclear prelamin A recognition factor-like protein n=1 Tax=Tieghemostelium lacteum TaxID=361077 RepID=A0A152A237_TIELA|nr:nuclear prelamin A recognition factor-like protein [Tieghemostelium lacteum]|eukprot:KYR00286.1 nuclear prelamin A recognition factor-like protein [Tieghemostelium lacteum]